MAFFPVYNAYKQDRSGGSARSFSPAVQKRSSCGQGLGAEF